MFDNKKYNDKKSLTFKIFLLYWRIIWPLITMMPPGLVFFSFKRKLINLHGAQIKSGVKIYPGVKIYNPRNLRINTSVTIGRTVNLYSVGKIEIGSGTVISQDCVILTATHDYRSADFDLLIKNVNIGENVWLAKSVTVLPGVDICSDTVIGVNGLVGRSITASDVYVAPLVKRLQNISG